MVTSSEFYISKITLENLAVYLPLGKHCPRGYNKLLEWIGIFGPPHIYQCDNNSEFKDVVLIYCKHIEFRLSIVDPSINRLKNLLSKKTVS